MKLGEQWVEVIDGQEPLVKAVKPVELCQGCLYNGNGGGCWWSGFDDECEMGSRFIIKDLGILNEDGLIPCQFCGEYPSIKYDLGEYGFYLVELSCCHYHHGLACRRSDIEEFTTQIIDAWNRRA